MGYKLYSKDIFKELKTNHLCLSIPITLYFNFFQNRSSTVDVDTWACGYTDNSVEGFASPFMCKAGCKRWHDSHLRKDPDYKDIFYDSNKKMFNLNLPKNLEVSHLSGEGMIKENKVARFTQ